MCIRDRAQAEYCSREGGVSYGCHTEYGEGQNVADCEQDGSVRTAVKRWYEQPGSDGEVADCGVAPHSLVWRTTTHVGAATSADGRFVVANYRPAENVPGECAANLFPPTVAEAQAKSQPLLPKHHSEVMGQVKVAIQKMDKVCDGLIEAQDACVIFEEQVSAHVDKQGRDVRDRDQQLCDLEKLLQKMKESQTPQQDLGV
eukprot:TRINITY_DN4080_c0_g1_i2.p1 TRINITY_DN4080_c0_g1~~TRINITY_DN4080_c0_g1_i2.p1  ORF type:complete len:201 (-),score=40.39 TRINITY_DN4080_c0_g1_i2:436-1038(-)